MKERSLIQANNVRPSAAKHNTVFFPKLAASSRKRGPNQSWNMAKKRALGKIPHQTRLATCILTVTFNTCALTKQGREARTPLACCQWCGLYQFVYKSAQGLFFFFNCHAEQIDSHFSEYRLTVLAGKCSIPPAVLHWS